MQEGQQPEPKPQAGVPPPRPPRGPVVVVGGPDEEPPDNRKKEVRITLPLKSSAPSTATVINWPTTPVIPKRKPWWKFW